MGSAEFYALFWHHSPLTTLHVPHPPADGMVNSSCFAVFMMSHCYLRRRCMSCIVHILLLVGMAVFSAPLDIALVRRCGRLYYSPIINIFIRSKEIGRQTSRSTEIGANFACFWPLKIFWGGSPKISARNYKIEHA